VRSRLTNQAIRPPNGAFSLQLRTNGLSRSVDRPLVLPVVYRQAFGRAAMRDSLTQTALRHRVN